MALPAVGATFSAIAKKAAPYIPDATAYIKQNAGRAYTAAATYVQKSTGRSLPDVVAEAAKKPSSALAVMEGFVRGGVPKNILGAALGDSFDQQDIAEMYRKLRGIDNAVETRVESEAMALYKDPAELAYYAGIRRQVEAMFPQLRGKINEPGNAFHGMRRTEVLRKFLEVASDTNDDAIESFDRVRYGD